MTLTCWLNSVPRRSTSRSRHRTLRKTWRLTWHKRFGPEKQRAELADPRNTFLIAENDAVAIGYAQLRAGKAPACVSDPQAIELVRLYVSSTFQGSGIGGRLMEACLTEARQAGYQRIWLGVWQQNTRAQAFYKRWKFSIVGEHVFQLGDDPQMDWLMERSLDF
jgi:diamine N-acetyltransferase